MNEINFNSDEFKDTSSYTEFMNENQGEGILKIQAYTADQAFPLENVLINIYHVIDGKKVLFFSGITDSSGIIDNINLPTVKLKNDISSSDDIYYTTYEIDANYPKSGISKIYDVGILDNVKAIQPVRIPITNLIEGEQYNN